MLGGGGHVHGSGRYLPGEHNQAQLGRVGQVTKRKSDQVALENQQSLEGEPI
jgi:hypothetical protein